MRGFFRTNKRRGRRILPGCQEERRKGSSWLTGGEGDGSTWLTGGEEKGFFLADRMRGRRFYLADRR